MARKAAAARPRPAASPVPAALERLAKLSGAGTAAPRMAREAEKIMADWQAAPDTDSGTLRENLESLRDNLLEGVASAEEQAGDVDSSDKGAVKQAATTLNGLRAACEAVAAALG